MKNIVYSVYDFMKKKQLQHRLKDFKIAEKEEVSHYEMRKSVQESLASGDVFSDFEEFEKQYQKDKK